MRYLKLFALIFFICKNLYSSDNSVHEYTLVNYSTEADILIHKLKPKIDKIFNKNHKIQIINVDGTYSLLVSFKPCIEDKSRTKSYEDYFRQSTVLSVNWIKLIECV